MRKIFLAILLSTLGFAKSNPIMKVEDTRGKTFTIEGTSNGLIINELKNKIVFVEFFGHNCPPCLKTILHLKTLQAKYKDRLVIVAIEVQGFSSPELEAFAAQERINYITIAQDKGEDLLNYIGSRAKWNGSIPFLTVLDKKGNVQLLQAGFMPLESLDQTIQKLSVPMQGVKVYSDSDAQVVHVMPQANRVNRTYSNQSNEPSALQTLGSTLDNINNQMRERTYQTNQSTMQIEQLNNQMYQQRQDRQRNMQMQQINNNLNGIRYGY